MSFLHCCMKHQYASPWQSNTVTTSYVIAARHHHFSAICWIKMVLRALGGGVGDAAHCIPPNMGIGTPLAFRETRRQIRSLAILRGWPNGQSENHREVCHWADGAILQREGRQCESFQIVQCQFVRIYHEFPARSNPDWFWHAQGGSLIEQILLLPPVVVVVVVVVVWLSRTPTPTTNYDVTHSVVICRLCSVIAIRGGVILAVYSMTVDQSQYDLFVASQSYLDDSTTVLGTMNSTNSRKEMILNHFAPW